MAKFKNNASLNNKKIILRTTGKELLLKEAKLNLVKKRVHRP